MFPANCRHASLIHYVPKENERTSLILCMQIDIKERKNANFFSHRSVQANQNLCKIFAVFLRLSGGLKGFGNDPEYKVFLIFFHHLFDL